MLDGHVLAAAFEAPLDDADREMLGDEALERAALLPELRTTPAGYVWAGRDYPAARVPLRSASPDAFTVVDASTGTVLGLVERERAYSTVHEGAVYLHLGEAYRVATLDLAARQALVEPFAGDWYTQAKKETTTAIEAPVRVERRLGLELSFGRSRSPSRSSPTRGSRSRRRRRSTSSRSTCRRRPSRRRRSGSARSRRSSKGSSGCRSCSAPCTRPSTR